MPPPRAISLCPAPRVPTPPAMALRRSTRRSNPPPPPTPLEVPPQPALRVSPPPVPFLRRSVHQALDSAGATQSPSPNSTSDCPDSATPRIGLPPQSSSDFPPLSHAFSPNLSSSSLIGLSRELFPTPSALFHPALITVPLWCLRASSSNLLPIPVLNLDSSGRPLTFSSAISGPFSPQWACSDGDELIKLVEVTRTLVAVHFCLSPPRNLTAWLRKSGARLLSPSLAHSAASNSTLIVGSGEQRVGTG
jgi:hypothetical protein